MLEKRNFSVDYWKLTIKMKATEIALKGFQRIYLFPKEILSHIASFVYRKCLHFDLWFVI